MTTVDTARTVTFQVIGTPAPQGSKRYVGKGRIVEMSKNVKPWREAVAGAARDAYLIHEGSINPFDGPLQLIVAFRIARPGSHFGTGRNAGILKPNAPQWVSSPPDLSKLVRSTEDALTTSGLIRDDARIARIGAIKVYADPADPWTGATITVRELGEVTL